MKTIKKILCSILISLMTLFVIPTVMPIFETGYTVEAATVKISKTKYTMNKGEKYTLKVKGTKKKVKWSTSNKKVATVNSKGKVTAKKKGTVTITAKVGSKKYKCKITVEDPSISKSKINLEEGNTYTLKVKNTKTTVKWSSSDKKIATVNSKGKVTAKKVGTATITAKVGNKKLKCKVTVVSTDYKKNIAISYLETDTSVIAILTNNNSVAISIKPDMIFYDENGKIQSKTSDFNYCFEPKSTIALEFKSYNSSTYMSQTYSSYKMVFSDISKSFYTTYGVKDISVSPNETDGSILAEVTNISSNRYDFIKLAVVYYDINNSVIGFDDAYAYCENPGTTDYVELDYPYDENYRDIKPASYKIYVNYAY